MTQRAYPLNDTMYTAEDVRLFHVARYSGIFNATGNDLHVTSNGGLNLSVTPGYAFLLTGTEDIGGITYASYDTEAITIDTPGAVKRYDYVSIRYNKSTNEALLTYKKGGTSAPTPVRNSSQYEIILAIIEVPANASSISNKDIRDVRLDKTYCGLVVDGTERIPTEGYQNEFNDFMDSIKTVLSGDVAGNLLNKINANESAIKANTTGISSNRNNIDKLNTSLANLGITKVTWGTTQKSESDMVEGELFLLLKG